MIKNISNLGDAAIYCDFGTEVNEIINSKVIDYFDYITNLVNEKKIEVPVCCDDEYGLDFYRLSEKLKLSKEEILNLYFNKEYFCYMTGFIAGMPFLGDINKKIRCNRLETPRVSVPEGAVGITEQFANIYTFKSPGGWNIIGNTPKKLFTKSNLKNPALIKPGYKVKFYQITKKEYLNLND